MPLNRFYLIGLPLAALLIGLALVLHAWRSRSKPLVSTFLVLMSSLIWWSLAVILEHASPGLMAKVLWVKMSYLGILALPPAWLVFTLQYAGRDRLLTRRNLILLTIMPAVTLFMVWTNDAFHMMWQRFWLDTSFVPPVDAVSHNIWFWVQAGYDYLLILLGTMVLLGVFLRSSGLYRKQVGIMLLAALVPWAANILFIAGIGPFSVVDPTPLAFAITGGAFLMGLSRLQLLMVTPIAHEAIFRNMTDGVIVVDAQNRITDINHSAEGILSVKKKDVIGRPYSSLWPGQPDADDLKPETPDTARVVLLGKDETSCFYEVHVSPIHAGRRFTGHLVMLHDDTGRRKTEAEAAERIQLETELTEHKKGEAALKASEAKYRSLVDSLQEGVYQCDLDGTYVTLNDAGARILGFDSPEQAIGRYKTVDLYCDASDLTHMVEAIRTAGRFSAEFRARKRDGGIIWMLLNNNTRLNGRGDIVGYEGMFSDITERKQAEEKYSTLVERGNDSIIIVQDSVLKFFNAKLLQITGYDYEQAFGKPFMDFITPGQRQMVADTYQKRMAGEPVPTKYETEILTRDGRTVPVEINANVIDFEGRPADMAIIRDITERKQAEAAYRSQKELIDRILATTPSSVLVIDENDRITLANRTFYESFGLETTNVEGRPLGEVIPAGDLSEAVRRVQLNGSQKLQLEIRHRTGGGERIFIGSVLMMQQGETLLAFVDVTEERERQQRLYLTDRLASVGEMAAGIAHELNNPLTSVIGLSRLLLDEGVPEGIKEDLEGIYHEAQRAASVIKNMLTFARKHTPTRQSIQITRVVEDVLKLRAYEHRVNNIKIDNRSAPDLPEIMVDYFQMQQVFLNLILNAEQAMIEAHKGGTLSIAYERLDGHISIALTDDGPGITPENMRKLFSPFFTTKEVGKGTGLGLSICYGILKNHCGRIYASSEPGHGATFVVELPVNAPGEGGYHGPV